MEMFDLNYTPNRTKLGSSVNVKCCFPSLSLSLSLSLCVCVCVCVEMMREITGLYSHETQNNTHTGQGFRALTLLINDINDSTRAEC